MIPPKTESAFVLMQSLPKRPETVPPKLAGSALAARPMAIAAVSPPHALMQSLPKRPKAIPPKLAGSALAAVRNTATTTAHHEERNVAVAEARGLWMHSISDSGLEVVVGCRV